MASNAPSLDTLIANVDELYALAHLTECSINVPISSLRISLERNIEKYGSKYAAKLSRLASKSKPEEIILVGGVLVVAWLGASAVDVTANAIARKQAKDALFPMYKEIAVKTQAIILQMSEDNKALTNLLLEEKERNVDNQIEIEKLKKRIEKGEDIIKRFAALHAKG